MIYPEFKVCVRCFTYNHSKFIRDAMDGFTMQRTDFPFVCCIVDDASTDGEQQVIYNYLIENFNLFDDNIAFKKDTQYAEIIYAQHKINKNCYFAVLFLKDNLYSKEESYKKYNYIKEWLNGCEYESLCEGDDYWIDSNKLQIEVNFLDDNPNYSICSHRVLKYDQDSKVFYKDVFDRLFKDQIGIKYNSRSDIWLSETCSVVYRLSADEEYNNYPYTTRDNIHVYYLLKKGLGMCLNNTMGVYRQHEGGIYAKRNVQEKMVDGSYKALKQLHSVENTEDSKYLYYKAYAYTFALTKGRIVFAESFELCKVLSLFINLPKILYHKLFKYRSCYIPIK